MLYLTIDEVIKTIQAKSERILTYGDVALLCKKRELKVCFLWWSDNCHLGLIDSNEPSDLIEEIKLIAVRSLNFDGELYLTPFHRNDENAVFRAIETNAKEPIQIEVVRGLGYKSHQLLLIQDISDQYLEDIDSTYKNGWQFFDVPKYFFEFVRDEGASASYKITVSSLRITEVSLSAYIAKTQEKSVDLAKIDDEHSEPSNYALWIATQVINIIPIEHHALVTKAGLARAVLDNLRRLGYSKKIMNDEGTVEAEEKIIRSIKRWINNAKPSGGWGMNGEIRPPTKDEQKQSKALIDEAIATLFEGNNSQN